MRVWNSNDPEAGLTVVKVGGSLLDWPELPARLEEFLAFAGRVQARGRPRFLLITGGGPAADLIRSMDRIHRLGPVAAHRLAVQAMDWTASLLESLLPSGLVVDRPEGFHSAWNQSRIPILAPRRFLEDFDDRSACPLARSWDVTADSIAARVALLLEGKRLVLFKSRSLSTDITREEAARTGLVDPAFPGVSRDLERVFVVGLRDSATIAHALLRPDHAERDANEEAAHGRGSEA